MIDAAFLTLLVVALLCRHGAALLFVSTAIAHDVLFGQADGFAYYGTAAFFDYLVLLCVRRSLPIQIICLSSIALNAFGYMSWFLYLEPTMYNYSLLSLYIITGITCMQDGGNGLGSNRSGGLDTGFHFTDNPFSFLGSWGKVRL